MNAEHLIASLERFTDCLPAVVGNIAPDDARWRPGDGHWSILEIVTHLADEEVEDFRMRLRLTLEDPQQPWPLIDPEGWAIERRYNEGTLEVSTLRFVSERRKSVEWLKALSAPDWSKTHHHSRTLSLRAGDLLASWAAHDALHLRQIAKRFHQLAQRDAGEYDSRYAGAWTA